MWKSIILAGLLAAVNGSKIEDFTGEWTPVALFPPVIFLPVCYHMSFTLSPEHVNCSCADGKKTEVLEVHRIDDGTMPKDYITIYPTLIVDDVNEVTNSLNVSCTCGEQVYPNRVIIKSINNNYFVLYKPQSIINSEPNAALVYAKEVPGYQALANFMKDIPYLNNRSGGFLCSSEFLNADLLSKLGLRRNETLDKPHSQSIIML